MFLGIYPIISFILRFYSKEQSSVVLYWVGYGFDPILNVRSETMRNKSRKLYTNTGTGKLVKGLLLGSVVGATVGWLTAPASGEETRRRLTGETKSAREKIKTAEDNVESQARELADEVNRDTFPTAG
jgi:hypothetical protein